MPSVNLSLLLLSSLSLSLPSPPTPTPHHTHKQVHVRTHSHTHTHTHTSARPKLNPSLGWPRYLWQCYGPGNKKPMPRRNRGGVSNECQGGAIVGIRTKGSRHRIPVPRGLARGPAAPKDLDAGTENKEGN